MKLSPAVDVPVTVNTVWTGPDGFMATNTAILEGNTTYTYASTVMVSSFEKDQSGNYTCKATISSNLTNSSTQLSDTEEIIHGTVTFTNHCSKFLLCVRAGYIQITDNGSSQILGEPYSLTCSVIGASNVTSYNWMKNETVVTTNQSLSFLSLGLSDAGQYTCEVIVDSLSYTNSTEIILEGM